MYTYLLKFHPHSIEMNSVVRVNKLKYDTAGPVLVTNDLNIDIRLLWYSYA